MILQVPELEHEVWSIKEHSTFLQTEAFYEEKTEAAPPQNNWQYNNNKNRTNMTKYAIGAINLSMS